LSHFQSFGHRQERQTKKDFSPADLAGEKHFAPQAQAAVSAHCFVNELKCSSSALFVLHGLAKRVAKNLYFKCSWVNDPAGTNT
jgi:hypothetical protein